MNDDTLSAVRDHLRQVSDSLGEVHLSIPAGEIAARASRRRRHRWLAATGAACAALALTLGLALPSGNPARPARPVHVHLAAWSVDSNRDGTVTLTVRDLTHVALLARVLGEAGVPAVIALHAQCLSTQNQNALDRSGALRSGRAGVVIHPAAIPAGIRILIGLLTADQVRVWSPSTGWQRAGHGHQVVGFGWAWSAAANPCTASPPTTTRGSTTPASCRSGPGGWCASGHRPPVAAAITSWAVRQPRAPSPGRGCGRCRLRSGRRHRLSGR